MALTKTQLREILSTAGVTDDNLESAIQKIMDGHITSVNALREERDDYKSKMDLYKKDADQLPVVQKELNDLKEKGDPDWQQKFDDEHKAFEDYKSKIAAEKDKAERSNLYRKLLKDCNVEEKRIDSILKITDVDGLKIKDGKFENEDSLKESIASEWASFINVQQVHGADVDKPPANGGGGKEPESRAAKLAAEYHESLYGKKGD